MNTTVFVNADFVSFNDSNMTYSVMVISGKEIVYVGYNTPICYDSERVVDLGGKCVIPLINDEIFFDPSHARCRVLAEGQRADFIVLDKNPLKEKNPQIVAVYKKGKKIIQTNKTRAYVCTGFIIGNAH